MTTKPKTIGCIFRRFSRYTISFGLTVIVALIVCVTTVTGAETNSSTRERSSKPVAETVFVVVGTAGKSFDETILPEIRKLPDVQAVAPLVLRNTILSVGEKRIRCVAHGIDPDLEREVREYDIAAG